MSDPAEASADRGRFPGYAVALVSTLAMVATAPGQTMLVSQLNAPLRETFGLTPLGLNAAYTMATIAAAIPLVWVGKLTDRWGPRRALVRIATAFGLACALMASVPDGRLVVAGFFLLRFLGQGSLALVSAHALAMWFHHRLGALQGWITVACFALWAPLPAVVQAAIAKVGWRWTWVGLGAAVVLVVVPLTMALVVDRPEEVGWTVDGRRASADAPPERTTDLRGALREPAFWLLAFSTGLSAMVGTAVLFDLGPLLADRGFDAAAAARSLGLWGVVMATLALPAGWAVDRIAPRWLLASGCSALGCGCLVLHFGHQALAAQAGLALLATGQSFIVGTVGATTARAFGRVHHGAIRSSISRLGVVATALGPLAFGLSQAWQGDFGPALLVFASLCGAGALAIVASGQSVLRASPS